MKKIVMLIERGAKLPTTLLTEIGHEGYAVDIVHTVHDVQKAIDSKQYGVIFVDVEDYDVRDKLSEVRPEIFGCAYDIFDEVAAANPEFLDAMKAELARAFAA